MAKNLREKRVNQFLYISIGCAIAVLALLIILFMIFSSKLNNETIDMQMGENNNLEEDILENASSSIGKSVDKLDANEEVNKEVNGDNQIEVQVGKNTTTQENVDLDSENNQSNNDNNSNNYNTNDMSNSTQTNNETSSNEKQEDDEPEPTFTKPVEGEIVKQYAKEKLLYSNTLKEWTTHLGIDIKADKTTVVKSSADGVIKSIKNDPRYGLTVVIEHSKGFSSVYSNLLTAEFVVAGETVKAGQTIGTIGSTATFEILDDPHLHFEILKDGYNVDPEMYIK